MKRVGVRDLKARLSEHLASVKAGEEVVVTQHGRSVAKIVPMPAEGTFDEHTTDIIRRGILRPPKHRPTPEFWKDFFARPKIKDPEGKLLKALLDEREEGW